MAAAATAPAPAPGAPGPGGFNSAPEPNTQGEPSVTMVQSLTEQLDGVQWDWTSSMPLPHLTYIVNCMMPGWHPTVAITGEVKEKQEQVRRELLGLYSGDPTMKVLLSGSFTERVSVPTFFKRSWQAGSEAPAAGERLTSDVDMMVEAVGKEVGKSDRYKRQIDTSSPDLHPGYLHVVYGSDDASEDLCVKKNDKFYLSSAKITQTWCSSVQQKLKAEGIADHSRISITGPALTVQGEETLGIVYQDTVICLHCPEWPDEAKEWISRERPTGWPPQSVREDIIESGFHIVPVAHRKSTWPEAEWRFSFSQAEVKLCHTLTLPQRQCYMLFKMLVKNQLLPDLISSYCLKNLFYHCMERIPEQHWEDTTNNLGTIFLYLLDELMYAIINHDLPHYFIPSNNLIAHIPEDFADDLMAKVSKIRRDPVKYLLAFDKIFMFPYSPIKSTFAEVFAPILEHSKKYDNNLSNCHIAQWNTTYKLLVTYIKELQALGAWEAAKQMAELSDHLDKTFDPLVQLEGTLLQTFPPHHAALFYELLMPVLPEVPPSLYGNLGCMYTSLYCTEEDEAKKDEHQQKANSAFQQALDGQEIHCSTAVDYTVFLRKSNRSEDAIQLLLRVLPREAQNLDKVRNNTSYGKSEKPSLDENLKAEVDDTESEIAAPSVVFGFYQLAQCYLETNQAAKVQEELLAEFEALCNKYPELALGFSLLGYTYRDLGNYKSAHAAFSRALEIQPNSSLAENNKTLCEAMMLSLDIDDNDGASTN